jgi:glucose-6-phosphate dehydrogenase assembly protein OpcA
MLLTLAKAYQPGDTDLSWTRSTPWRSLLAATLDQPHAAISGGRVEAERDNPSADLIASWLSVRLGVPFENRVSGGPGVTAVIFGTSDGEITLTRPDGRVAMLRRPGEPERRVALHRRDTAELLSEELRRLDPDEVYAETIVPFITPPAPSQVKRNGGGSSRKRVPASADAPRKDRAR